MKRLDDRTWVSGQVRPEDVPALAARGFRSLVNNRPDREEPGQPPSAQLEAAARAAGLGYSWIPVAHGISAEQVGDMVAALADGPALAFCRSGTRSTYLWALAQSRNGEAGASIVAKAAAAGYDLAPLRPLLGA